MVRQDRLPISSARLVDLVLAVRRALAGLEDQRQILVLLVLEEGAAALFMAVAAVAGSMRAEEAPRILEVW